GSRRALTPRTTSLRSLLFASARTFLAPLSLVPWPAKARCLNALEYRSPHARGSAARRRRVRRVDAAPPLAKTRRARTHGRGRFRAGGRSKREAQRGSGERSRFA